jgi:hypothetical protein
MIPHRKHVLILTFILSEPSGGSSRFASSRFLGSVVEMAFLADR